MGNRNPERLIAQYGDLLDERAKAGDIDLYFLFFTLPKTGAYYAANVLPVDLPRFLEEVSGCVGVVETAHMFRPKGESMPTVTIPPDRIAEVFGKIGKRNAEPFGRYPAGTVILNGIEAGRSNENGLYCVLRFRRYSPPPPPPPKEGEPKPEPPLESFAYLYELSGGNAAIYVP